MSQQTAPYVIPREGERVLSPRTVVGEHGVAYADPVQDARHRGPDGMLRAVCGGVAAGRPAYAREQHPDRQRETMDGLLCAGCGGPAAYDEDGTLWVLPLPDPLEVPVWEGVRTVLPPMCEECRTMATQGCPRLRDGHVELRVREAEKIGVIGTLHPRPGQTGQADPDALVRYGSPDARFVVARQIVRELRQVTVITPAGALSRGVSGGPGSHSRP